MKHNIDGLILQEQPSDICPGCCFFDQYGCLMPVNIAIELQSQCAEKQIIYKDITNAKGSTKEVK